MTIAQTTQTQDTTEQQAPLLSDDPLETEGLDTIATDSLKTPADKYEQLGIRISPSALSENVKAKAKDSALIDLANDHFYLFGEADVIYGDIQLQSDTIDFDQKNSLLIAHPRRDSLGNISVKGQFKQKEESFTFDGLRYNFSNQKAIVHQARTQYGEGFVHSQQVKRNPDQSIFGYKNVYTTCNLDTPHFGIRANRIRVIPNRVIASGPANIEIENVPTPLYLPFGLFPISKKQTNGFKIPTYTVENQRGIGFLDGGYYLHLNRHLDLLATTRIYTKGSWGLGLISNYNWKYQYSGKMDVSYAYNKNGEVYERNGGDDRSFFIRWNHVKDPKSRPGTNFNISLNLGSTNFYKNNSYNVNQIMQNDFRSNISYAKNWVGKPYSLTISANHDQNNNTGLFNINLPGIRFNVQPQTPFAKKVMVGAAKWYEKITVGYDFDLQNRYSFYDSNFSLNNFKFRDLDNGMKHSVPISANYNVARYINLSFNAGYNEYWLTEKVYHYFNPLENKIDTFQNDGFYTARDFNTNVSTSTRIYGMKTFKKGKVMGIRHVLNPSLSFNYRPDFAQAPFNYGYKSKLSAQADSAYYSQFATSIVGYPAIGRQGTIGFSLNNNLQMKVRDAKDAAKGSRNITLIDGLSASTAYNLAADSFNLAPLNVSFRTNLNNNLLNISGGANWDFYEYDCVLNRRMSSLLMSNSKGFARFNNANLSLNASLKSKTNTDGTALTEEQKYLLSHGRYYDYVDFNVPWNVNVSYSLNLNRLTRMQVDSTYKDSFAVQQTLMLRGDINLTERWKLAVSTGYNFQERTISITEINIYRDLHCWEMRLQAFPFGERKSYSFVLNVKASVLQDLKLNRRRDFRDAIY